MDSATWMGVYGPVYSALMDLALSRDPMTARLLPASDGAKARFRALAKRADLVFARVTGLRQVQRDTMVQAMINNGMVEFEEQDDDILIRATNRARMYGVARLLLHRRNLKASKVLLDCPACGGEGCGLCGGEGEFEWDHASDALKKAFREKEGADSEDWEPPPAIWFDVARAWEDLRDVEDTVFSPDGSDLPGRSTISPFKDLQVLAALGPVAGPSVAGRAGPYLTNSKRVAFLLTEMGIDPVEIHVASTDPEEASALYDQTPFNVVLAEPEELARDMRRQFSRVVLELGSVSEETVASVTETVAHGVKDGGVLCAIGGLSFSGELLSRFESNVAAVEALFGADGDAKATPENVATFVNHVSIMMATTPWTKVGNLNIPGLPRPGYLVSPVPGGEPGFYCLRGGASVTEFVRALCRLSFNVKSYQVPTHCFISTDGMSSTGFALVSRTFRSRGSRYEDACMAQCMAGDFSFFLVEPDSPKKDLGVIRSMRERVVSVPEYVSKVRSISVSSIGATKDGPVK